jgi:hypothetical protein
MILLRPDIPFQRLERGEGRVATLGRRKEPASPKGDLHRAPTNPPVRSPAIGLGYRLIKDCQRYTEIR